MVKRILSASLIFIMLVFTKQPVMAVEKLTEDEVYTMAEEIGAMYNISPDFLTAVAFKESSFRPTVTNGNCVGLCQVNPNCHGDRMKKLGLTREDLFTAYGNLLCSADYFAELFEKYGEASLALDKYNGNSKAQAIYDSGKLSKYARGVLDYAYDLEERKGKHEATEEADEG